MPRSYWVIFFALGLALLTGVALSQEKPPALESDPIPAHGQEESTAESQQEPANQNQTSLDLAPLLREIETVIRNLKPNVDEVERERQKQNEIADLQAQQDMAFWAERMFWATFGTLAAAIAGVIYVRHTLFETRRIGQAQVRAYLSVKKGIKFDWIKTDDSEHPHAVTCKIYWHNSGQSPALNCNGIVGFEFLSKNQFRKPVSDFQGVMDGLDFSTASIGLSCSKGFGPLEFTKEDISSWLKGNTELVIYSAIIYRDVFKVEHRIESCSSAHHFDPDDTHPKARVEFRVYPHHNND